MGSGCERVYQVHQVSSLSSEEFDSCEAYGIN